MGAIPLLALGVAVGQPEMIHRPVGVEALLSHHEKPERHQLANCGADCVAINAVLHEIVIGDDESAVLDPAPPVIQPLIERRLQGGVKTAFAVAKRAGCRLR